MQNLRLSSVRSFHLLLHRGEGSARLWGGGGGWGVGGGGGGSLGYFGKLNRDLF